MAKRRAKKREEIVRLFAERLRELRLSRGMTQAELARRAGVSVTYVSQLESADTAPGIDLVARVAKALGITTTELLPRALATRATRSIPGAVSALSSCKT